MPFRSEKQRRYLWATQPELAKRWAHEYPQKKKLPLYAHEDGKDAPKEKKQPPTDTPPSSSKAAELTMANTIKLDKAVNTVGLRIYDKLRKQAESAAVKIEIPRSEKPVAAGDESISVKKTDENNPGAEVCDNTEKAHVSPLMAKLSVVLSQKIQQAIADDEAAQAGAESQQVPQNAGLKDYPVGSPTIPPPMGSAPTAPPASQTQDPSAGQGTMPPVGGGSHPSANPINSYGGLSVNGDINGNAAFGAPGGSKTAGKLGLWDRIRAKKERGEKPAKPGDKDYPDAKSWKKVTSISEKKAGTPAWQRSEGKNSEGGLNEKGRKSYERETGGNLKAPVTEKNPKGKRAKRQNSFCARMCGMKRVNTGSKAKKDPDSRINKSLRKWNCKCSSAMEFGIKMAAGTFEELGGDVGSLAGLPAGIGGIAAVQHLSDPANVAKLQLRHGANAMLPELRRAVGLPVSLKQRLGQMTSKGIATGLKYLPKTPAGRMAAGIGAPLAAFLGAGLAGNAAGSAVGRQFDK